LLPSGPDRPARHSRSWIGEGGGPIFDVRVPILAWKKSLEANLRGLLALAGK